MAQHGDMAFMEMMQDSMGKRERTGTSYAERDFHRQQGAASSTDKALPKVRCLLVDMMPPPLAVVRRYAPLQAKKIPEMASVTPLAVTRRYRRRRSPR